MYLCVREAGKSWVDAVAELRETIDFCRYYGTQALKPEYETRECVGTIACISPWNFPLAIFLGQVTASLAAGNTVICKPAEQTPLIAYEAVKILHAAGVDTIKELRTRNADNLAEKMDEVNKEKNLANACPNASVLQGWIDKAKDMEPLITH